MDGTLPETKRLRHNVEWALRRALDPATVLPMLHRLSRLAADGSDESLYAQRRLAELLVDHHPWRAALAARRVLAAQPGDDGAWAILALCQALLGHYRYAVSAYRRAASLAPDNAAYAHNLGHLLDVTLDAPKEALPWLHKAYELSERRTDVAASLVHALARAGDITQAKQVSRRAMRAADKSMGREHAALADWLNEGAPSAVRLLPRRPPARAVRAPWTETEKVPRRRRTSEATELEATLVRGLASLPLDATQRSQARAMARHTALLSVLASPGPTLASVAAAIAYAVAYVDHVPLTQADVAACFRVSVPALRGAFKAIRARLDLAPRDARVATPQPR